MKSLEDRSMFGPRLRIAREHRRMTHQQLASALGLPGAQDAQDLEEGRVKPTSEQLMALTDILDRELDFFLDPFIVDGEAEFTWYGDLSGVDRKALEERAGKWVGMLRWLRAETGADTDPMEVLFVDLADKPGVLRGGECRLGKLRVAFFNRADVNHPGARRELPKLFSQALVARLHFCLDRGRLTYRKAAIGLDVDLQTLGQLFIDYGMSDPRL